MLPVVFCAEGLGSRAVLVTYRMYVNFFLLKAIAYHAQTIAGNYN